MKCQFLNLHSLDNCFKYLHPCTQVQFDAQGTNIMLTITVISSDLVQHFQTLGIKSKSKCASPLYEGKGMDYSLYFNHSNHQSMWSNFLKYHKCVILIIFTPNPEVKTRNKSLAFMGLIGLTTGSKLHDGLTSQKWMHHLGSLESLYVHIYKLHAFQNAHELHQS